MKRLLISSAIASAFALVGCEQPSGDDEYVDRMAEEH